MATNTIASAANRPFPDLLKGAVRKTSAFFAILGAARRAAGAVQVRRRPLARDLRLLGISPEAFAQP